MSETAKVKIGDSVGYITYSTLPDEGRIGDVYRCTHSRVEGRAGTLFEIKRKSDFEFVHFLDSYGDKFERTAEGSGKKVKGF